MKHAIRQRVIDRYGLPVTKIETVNGELGTVEFSNGHFGLKDDDGDWRDLDLCIRGEIVGTVKTEL